MAFLTIIFNAHALRLPIFAGISRAHDNLDYINIGH